MNVKHFLSLVFGAILLGACSPHPSSGKWRAIPDSDNELGIADLSILFDGKAEFVTTEKDKAVWHCFWGGKSQNVAAMNCVPSSDDERRETFTFAVNGADQGRLNYRGRVVATFERQPYE